jgi:large subunit ribosomal protein L32e
VDNLEDVNPNTQAIRIAHTVGARKRIEITAKARERAIHVLNPREVERPLEEETEVEAEAEITKTAEVEKPKAARKEEKKVES